jgi:hypothetical protein
MSGIPAARVIAGMENASPLIPFRVKMLIGHPMHKLYLWLL